MNQNYSDTVEGIHATLNTEAGKKHIEEKGDRGRQYREKCKGMGEGYVI